MNDSRFRIAFTILACLVMLTALLTGCVPAAKPVSQPAAQYAAQPSPQLPVTITADEATMIAHDATVFGFPLVIMDLTRIIQTNVPMHQPGGAPMNQFLLTRVLGDPSFTSVVQPNSDTLYDSAWVDTAAEPWILSLPDTQGRYYLMPMLNYWTDVFASPGSRTTGTKAGNFAITGPGWKGQLPDSVQEFKSSTRYVEIGGRIACYGPSDYQNVWNIQNQVKLTPLSAWGTDYVPPAVMPVDPTFDMKTPPLHQLLAMDAVTYFDYICRLMTDNPPYAQDAPVMAKFAQIGIKAGADFKAYYSGLDSATQSAIQDGYKAALIDIPKKSTGVIKNGWYMNYGQGDFGTDYDFRATVAYNGLLANISADAVYASSYAMENGQPYFSYNNYTLHFSTVPPVNGFWSLTLYNDKMLLVANPINRYKVGSLSDPPLKVNADGSIDLYIQRYSPGADKENNWLPAPASGGFHLTLRLYWPKEEVLNKSWVPPAVQLVQ